MNLSDPIDVLARTVFGEARNQGALGMHAVASVVLNRVAHPTWWGKDIISVCLDREQFDCWNADDPNLLIIQDVTIDDPVFLTASEISRQAVAGTLPDVTNGATTYKRTDEPWPASWGPEVQPLVSIGAHSFYQLA